MSKTTKAKRKFEVGHVVFLKSGGPKMTVTGYDASGTVLVTWFNDRQHPHGRAYPEGALRRKKGKP